MTERQLLPEFIIHEPQAEHSEWAGKQLAAYDVLLESGVDASFFEDKEHAQQISEMLRFFGERVLDQGMTKPVTKEILAKLEQDIQSSTGLTVEQLRKNNEFATLLDQLQGQKEFPPVLNSGTIPWLESRGFTSVAVVDVKSLFYANQASKVNGDIYLQRVCLNLLDYIKSVVPQTGSEAIKIVRVGGDEFEIYIHEDVKRDSIPTFQAELVNAAEKTNNLFIVPELKEGEEDIAAESDKKKGFLVSRPCGVKVKTSSPYQKPPIERGEVPDRLNRLITLFPQQKEVFKMLGFDEENPNTSISEETRNQLLTLMEDLVFDSTLDAIVEDASNRSLKLWGQVYQINPEMNIFSLRSQNDVVEHFQQIQEQGQQIYTQIRVELPGRLKPINDTPGLGYRAGNDFINYIANALVIAASEARFKTIDIVRQGSDFTINIPQDVGEEELEIFNSNAYALLADVHYSLQREGITKVVPLDVVVVATKGLLRRGTIIANDGKSDEILANNREQFYSGHSQLASEAGDKGLEAMLQRQYAKLEGINTYLQRDNNVKNLLDLENYFELPDVNHLLDSNEWNVFSKYFSPHDKRGLTRLIKLPALANLDLKEEVTLVNVLKQYYKEIQLDPNDPSEVAFELEMEEFDTDYPIPPLGYVQLMYAIISENDDYLDKVIQNGVLQQSSSTQ